MRTKIIIYIIVSGMILIYALPYVNAQQPQLPTLQVCNSTRVEGQAVVKLNRRKDIKHSGVFKVSVSANCDPAGKPYPVGKLEIRIDMSDSLIQGAVNAVSFEQLTSTGKHTPTAYLTGRCKSGQCEGCRFWIMFADNGRDKETPDVIGFLMFDGNGQRVAYGTGAVVEGDITVTPSVN